MKVPIEAALPTHSLAPIMLSQLKRSLLGAAQPTGINRWMGQTHWRRQQLLILCYHSVALTDEAEWNSGLYCTPSFLRRRLEILRESDANVLPLGEALERTRAGALPPRSIVLTFDDGTVDFPQTVVPLLKEFKYTATLYPSTYYCDRNQPIWNVALRYLLWRGRALGSADLSATLHINSPLDISTNESREAAFSEIFALVKDLHTDAKHELLGAISRAVGVDFGAMLELRQFQLMTSEEMSLLPHDHVSVELHTHRHRTPNDRALFIKEIEDNRQFVVARRGVVPRHFCYPSGEYRLRFVDWLHELDVESATTCTPALVGSTTNPYLAPRFVDTMLTTENTFRAWVSGVAALAPKRSTTGVPADA